MFKLKLSPETRARLDAEHVELLRLYGLTDRWLGEALIRLARLARTATPDMNPDRFVYDDTFVWHVVPEIAHRLGVRIFDSRERGDFEISQYSNQELRSRAGMCLRNISSSQHYAKPGWSLLLHEPANGNPVVYAIDRLCPGSVVEPDPITERLAEIAGYRKVVFNGCWTPAMMG